MNSNEVRLRYLNPIFDVRRVVLKFRLETNCGLSLCFFGFNWGDGSGSVSEGGHFCRPWLPRFAPFVGPDLLAVFNILVAPGSESYPETDVGVQKPKRQPPASFCGYRRTSYYPAGSRQGHNSPLDVLRS